MFIIDWLYKQAEHRPNKLAMVDVATQRGVTYREFDERACRFGEFLRDEWGIQPGDRVAVLAHNSTDYMEMLYGCAKVGAIMVCLNWRLSVPELEFIIADAEPVALVFSADFMEAGRSLMLYSSIKHGMVSGQGAQKMDQVVLYEDALSQSSGQRFPMPNWPLDETWHLLYTSGTTGRPKGVLQTFGMVFFNAINSMLHCGVTERDNMLNALPFFHTGGLNLYTNPVIFAGGTVYIMNHFDVEPAIDMLNSTITMFLGVPAHYLFISQHEKFASARFESVRWLGAGGSPIANSLLEEFIKKGKTICYGFGMTETGPTVFITDAETSVKKVGSVGKPVTFAETRVVDPQGRDVGPNERGELIIRGPGVTPGYWHLPEATKKTIVDGWLYSGDIAYYDDDGDYYIVDRSKDMFISGGENVYPAEVENVLYALESIKEAAVIGVPDEKWVEVGKAIIVVADGQTLTAEQIKAHCKTHLAGYKVPKHFVFVDALPRNASGKVEKPVLRKNFGG